MIESECISGYYNPNEDIVVTLSGYATAPRWGAFETFLRKTCIENSIEVSTSNDGGWINITTYYTLKGKKSLVERVDYIINVALAEYAKR